MSVAEESAAQSQGQFGSAEAERNRRLVAAVANSVIAHSDELTALDAAIGDGDHGHNMKRGFEAVLQDLDALSAMSLPDLLKAVGTKLVMKVGGASGPLYGTLFLALARSCPREPSRTEAAKALAAAIGRSGRAARATRVRRRCSTFSSPAARRSPRAPIWRRSARRRRTPREATMMMRATRGRASFLGERSIGHMDPGARSSFADDRDDLRRIRRELMANVGIVIVSHSPKVAEGAADMVRQMVGAEVPLAWTGGDPGGGLGTSFEAITDAIHRAWSEAGVAVLVDLGGAETNSEMAIEMLGEDKRGRVVICNAPIVEGAVVAATEASGGASLALVRRTAEELSP